MDTKESYYPIAIRQKMVFLLNSNGMTVLIFAFSMLLFFTLIAISILTFNYANASLSLDQSIEQFQNNLQASIDKELRSILDSSNNSNSRCDSNNNISIQSQTNNNGKTTTTVLNSCNNLNFFHSFYSTSDLINKSGKIISSEYDLQTGVIINSLFGNWSLTTTDGGSKELDATFIKQPINYDISSTFTGNNSATSSGTDLDNVKRNVDITTTYHLSNFAVNSIQQQNEDITYSGKIDVIQEIIPEGTNYPVKSNTFKDVNVSISVLKDRTLTIHFDEQSKLFNEFRNIPLVGIVQ